MAASQAIPGTALTGGVQVFAPEDLNTCNLRSHAFVPTSHVVVRRRGAGCSFEADAEAARSRGSGPRAAISGRGSQPHSGYWPAGNQ